MVSLSHTTEYLDIGSQISRKAGKMMLPEFVMTPGPTEIPASVQLAMLKPAINPGDPKFIQTCDETMRLLQNILETKNEVIFFPGSGRVAIEAAITSVIQPGDRVLTINSGVFGKWLGFTVELAGGEKVELISNPRRRIDPDQVRSRLMVEKDIKLVAMVHNETSTGVVHEVGEIGKIVKEYGALFLVDTVSSAAGDFVKTDEWQIDLNCTGNYKCMNCPPGLAILAVSDSAWEVMANREVRRSFSFDLYKYMEMWIPPERGGKLIWGIRRHVVEPVPHITYALKKALEIIFEEGLAERFQKNRIAGKAIKAAAKAMGLELYPLNEESASNTLTVIVNPPEIDNNAIIENIKRDFGVVIAGGLEEVAGRIIRIAHMSNTSSEMHVLYTVRALEKTLIKLGWKIEDGVGINAASMVFDNP